MIEAIEEKERLGLTHVQLMDDDAVMDPELFVRAYGFLGMRKDEWEDIRLGEIIRIFVRRWESGLKDSM